jgi:putative spermidine/putrescine transport system ATP-binding protein
MARLEVKAVTKLYAGHAAVRNVSFAVEDGEFVTLLGPSGSGKTTLLMLVAGFAVPTEGSIAVDGADITAIPPERRDFGMVFQGYALFPHLTAEANVAFPLEVRGTPAAEVRRKVAATLELVQLGALAKRRPAQLSGGQQQRVALARALVFAPKLLLLDEPLSALDKSLRADMQRELKDLHRRTGVTFLHVTHDQEEALAMSDRIVVLNNGAIEQIGRPRDLYRRPRSAFVASFLGDNNLVEGRVGAMGGDGLAVECLGVERRLPRPETVPVPGTRVTLAIRPEHLALARRAGPGAVAGTVVETVFQGSREQVMVRIGEATLAIHVLPTESGAWQPDETVHVSWSDEDMHLVEGDAG